jgi:hypothetical protein
MPPLGAQKSVFVHAPQFVEMNRKAPTVMAMSAILKAGKWPRRPVEVEEVDHVAVHHAVDQVAQGAAHDQGQRPAEHALAGVLAQQVQDETDGADCDGGEEVALPAALVAQEAEKPRPGYTPAPG